SSPDSLYPRVASNCVPYPYWLEERHSFHCHRNNARLRSFRRKNSATQVHLRGQPSAENIPIRIGVLRHGNRLNNQFASGLLGHNIIYSVSSSEVEESRSKTCCPATGFLDPEGFRAHDDGDHRINIQSP